VVDATERSRRKRPRTRISIVVRCSSVAQPSRPSPATLVFDEFSAIAGGREAAIQLVERVRDASCALYLSAQSADGLGDEAQQRRLVGACSGGLLIHAMPDPDTLLRAAGVVKVVEQTWRLDSQGPTGNSSARIGERPRIEPGAVQQAREGEAWYIARGRFEHLMVARTTISDGYRARARAMVALARSWRPTEVLPGARTWVEAQRAGQEALSGLQGQLAIESPSDSLAADLPPEPSGPAPAGHRLRLAVAAAARDGDQDATATLVRQAPAHGVDVSELLAVAEAHWPKPRLHRRAFRAGRRWVTARLHRPRGRAALAEPERRP
jgi:hypothetical protein